MQRWCKVFEKVLNEIVGGQPPGQTQLDSTLTMCSVLLLFIIKVPIILDHCFVYRAALLLAVFDAFTLYEDYN